MLPIKIIVISFFISLKLFAIDATDKVCSIDKSIMVAIASVERAKQRPIGYPYLISFNNKKEASLIKKILEKQMFLDQRTIDCKNQLLCIKITKFLVFEKKITNLDLGVYQLNYKYHKMNLKSYFSFYDSYEKACSLIEELINKYGYTWKTIARYHSATPIHNYAYLKKISTIYGE